MITGLSYPGFRGYYRRIKRDKDTSFHSNL